MQSGEQLFPEAVAGKGPGLAHHGTDDVPVVDTGFPLAADPLHAFHKHILVVDFHPVGVQPELYLLADEAGGDRVSTAGCLDRAPLADPGPVVDVFRHGSWRHGAQVRPFLPQLPLDQPVASLDHPTNEEGIIVAGVEIAAASQDEGLVYGILQVAVSLLGDSVLVALAADDAGGLRP